VIRSHDEHAAVLTAIAQGDAEAASRLMRAHMLNASAAFGRFIAGSASD